MSKITEKILRDAELEAKRAIDTAQATADERLARAKQTAEAEAKVAEERARALSEAHANQQRIAAETKARRETLSQKHAHIDKVFATAREKIDTKKLAESLEKKFAHKGDTVTKKDGGIVIENANYTLSLTLDDLMADLRDKIESDIARILFS